jgi:diacylglycerol kinase family enzyme
MSRCILLLNLASGGNQRGLDAREVCQTVEEIFRTAGHTISSTLITPGGVENALQNAIAARPDLIIIGGGDGTVSAAARQLGGTDIALGIVPMGTFNLAARDLGVPLEIEAAAEFLATAEIFPIDVLEISGHACLCMAILGFYPEFSNIFETRDHGGYWWKKTIKLFAALRTTFVQARPLLLFWKADDKSGTARTKFSAFIPGRYKQTAGLIPSRTDFCSGKLTAYIGKHQKPASALRGILDYAFGRLEQDPELEIISTRMTLRAAWRRSCSIMLDGEILRLPFPIEMRILHKHLNVIGTPDILTKPDPH